MSLPRIPPPDPELSSRDLQVLQAIIDDYVARAEPVGSRSLSRGHGLEVSAATIRNVMSDLEALGYLAKPHTSAGRIPTPKAFRYYVDTMLRVRPLPSRARARVDREYQPPPDSVEALIQQTSRILATLTHHAAVVVTPRLSESRLRHIDFVRLREDRVLAVLVTQGGLVQNRPLTCEPSVSQEDLDRASRYLDELLGDGASLPELQRRIQGQLSDDRAAYDDLMRQALELGRQALDGAEDETDREVVVAGEQALIAAPEFADRDKMTALLEALQEKERLLGILDQAQGAEGIQFFIGVESALSGSDVSLVLGQYRQGDQVLGTLGVLGPTRMDYPRVVPFVEYTASLLTRMFEDESAAHHG